MHNLGGAPEWLEFAQRMAARSIGCATRADRLMYEASDLLLAMDSLGLKIALKRLIEEAQSWLDDIEARDNA